VSKEEAGERLHETIMALTSTTTHNPQST